ncbi:hypothetical protein JRQ81_017968 [Phrynocephalus forsythii]|uniref:Interleukin-12 subunit alpha n=1 Tax=Phrynocephalus forsythii TaxID=171643 RepID=A0A9Q0XRX8_9SAUR|nr:hypothetical protein JRQ81_017968 [Phrynocephalus forsythii]
MEPTLPYGGQGSAPPPTNTHRPIPIEGAGRAAGESAFRSRCWLLVAFFYLNLPTSSLAYSIHTRGLVASVNNLLSISEDLMRASDMALHQFQKVFQCTLDDFPIQNPKNEEKIKKACMEGKSMPASCSLGENSFVNEDSCVDTIYNILKAYAVEIKDFGTPDLLNAVSHMMKALKPAKHRNAEQPLYSPQHILNESYEMDMKQCKIFLTLQQFAHTVHRTLCYQKTAQMQMSR